MKILKIKLEIFNHNFHKYFSKINMSTTTVMLTTRPSNLLVDDRLEGPDGLAGRVVLGCSGPRAKQAVLVTELELSS